MKVSHGFSIDSIDNTFSFVLSFFIFDMSVTKFEIILYKPAVAHFARKNILVAQYRTLKGWNGVRDIHWQDSPKDRLSW